MESSIIDLEGVVGGLATDADSLQSDVGQLVAQFVALEEQVSGISISQGDTSYQVLGLVTDLVGLSGQLVALQGEVSGMSALVAEVEGQLESLDGTVDDMDLEMEGMKADVSNLAQLLAGLTEQLASVEGTAGSMEAVLADLVGAVDDLDARVTALEEGSQGSQPTPLPPTPTSPPPTATPEPIASFYQDVLDVLGPTAVLLPFVDLSTGEAAGGSFATLGSHELVFTWSEDVSNFDTPSSREGTVPVVTFNGTDEEADTPDAPYWSRDDATGEAWSVGLWINPDDKGSDGQLFTKTDYGRGEEWYLTLKSNETLLLGISDESEGMSVSQRSNQAIPVGTWTFVVVTYDGSGGANAANGITIYTDGSVFASRASNSPRYVAMEDLGTLVGLASYVGRRGSYETFDGQMAGGPLGPFFVHTELTADQIWDLYGLGKSALGLP